MSLFSVFFLIFIVITTALYFIVPGTKQWLILLIASYVFYYLEDGLSGFVFIIITTVTSYLAGILMERDKKGFRKAIMLSCILLNFGILGLLKYGGFVFDNVVSVFHILGIDTVPEKPLFILPLGISFYTFQTMGYVIDVYRKAERAENNFLRFALFISYFPQIIQGPIGRHEELAPQLEEVHRWDSIRFREGVLRVFWGFFKKIILAERAGVIVNEIYSNFEGEGYKGFIILIAGLLYGIQVYADFSGGMDIVFGVSDIFGIKLTENFRQPYFAKSVSEFWQRWHITLGTWMKNYVFYPICLSESAAKLQRKARAKFGVYYGRVIIPTIASFFTFILVGIWHGADWKYVVYGIYMAIFVSSDTFCEKLYGDLRERFGIDKESLSWKTFQILRTTFIILIGRLISRGNNVSDAFGMIKAMFSSFNLWVFSNDTLLSLGLDEKDMGVMLMAIVALFVVDYVNEKGTRIRTVIARKALPFRWAVYYLAIAGILVFGVYGSEYNASSFIYQNF